MIKKKNNKDYRKYWKTSNEKSIPSSLEIDISSLNVDHDAAILDIGCGNAELLKNLQSNGYRNLYGIDINPMLNHGKESVIGIMLSNQDASKLKFSNAAFDLAIMKALLTVVVSDYSIYKMLHEAYRVLRNGGILIIKDFFQNWHLDSYRKRYLADKIKLQKNKCIFPVYDNNGNIRYYARHFNTQELSVMLTKIGFIIKDLTFEMVYTQSGNLVIGFTIIAQKSNI